MTNAYALGEAASRTTGEVDSLFLFITGICLFFFLFVEGLLIYFAVRYRRRKGEEPLATSGVTGNLVLEAIWITIPSLVVISFFVYGFLVYRDVEAARPGAAEVHVVARQFFYTFQYPDGRRELGQLHVLAGRPVKLEMTSEDVIHGFFIPDYRIKQDILPGTYTYLWLSPDRPGTYDIFCTQYCGVGHSTMRAQLVVLSEPEYAKWEAAKGPSAVPLAQTGKDLVEKSGCLGCHSVDGSKKVGPTLKGLYGRRVTLADGSTVAADEGYIRESLLDPKAKIVKGFPNVMPTFKGTLSVDDITAVIAYLKTLSGVAEEEERAAKPQGKAHPSPEQGKVAAQKAGCLGCHTTDGSRKAGPTWKGLFSRMVELEGGRTVTADEAYLKESIRDPGAKIVKGFPNIMPSYRETLSEEELASIVTYIRTLK
jgi:cytochrome c oxidase subunit 2